MLKFILKAFSAALLVLILFFNCSLYYSPTFSQGEFTYNQDVYEQLQHLKAQLKNGAGAEMQEIFPEGFIFINALYGLSWANLIENLPSESRIHEEGIQEISWTLEEMNSPTAKSIFPDNTPLKYGAFYRGWSNYVLGQKLKAQAPETRASKDIQLFQKNCEAISEALKSSQSPYLESYLGQKWPADGIIAASNLKLHDEVFESPIYEGQLRAWTKKVKLNLDPRTGLIPHSLDAESDEIIEGARGCSQSLILNFIHEIDPVFSNDQFLKYKEHFLDYRMKMPGIREYPKGIKGFGDVDSGPVILGIGGAASIVGQRTMAKYKDWATFMGLRNCIEAFGLGMTFGNKKRYLFGQLPMADAFIVWSNAIENTKMNMDNAISWRIPVHLLSLLLMVFFAYPIFKL